MIGYKDLKEIAKQGYKKKKKNINGYIEYQYRENTSTGFFARVFVKDNNVIISYSGTNIDSGCKEFEKDFKSDLRMMVGILPKRQLTDALNLYYDVINDSNFEWKKYNIILTGHSLGGSLANLVGVITGAKVVGFSTFGVGDIIGETDLGKYKNITNIGATDGFIFMSNINKQLGNVKVFLGDEHCISMPKVDLNVIFNHSIDNIGNDLDDAENYKHGEIKSFYDRLDEKESVKYIKNVSAEFYNKRDSSQTYNSSNGHWVTIDGNHVFIEE